jgi:hypothetical protein
MLKILHSPLLAGLPHFKNQQFVSQSLVFGLQSESFIVDILLLLMDAFFFLMDLPTIILFHLLQSLLELSFVLIFVVFAECFDSRFKFVQNVSVVILRSFDLALEIVYLCLERMLFLFMVSDRLERFIFEVCQLLLQAFDLVVESSVFSVELVVYPLHRLVLLLSLGQVTLLQFSSLFDQMFNFFLVNSLIFIHL